MAAGPDSQILDVDLALADEVADEAFVAVRGHQGDERFGLSLLRRRPPDDADICGGACDHDVAAAHSEPEGVGRDRVHAIDPAVGSERGPEAPGPAVAPAEQGRLADASSEECLTIPIHDDLIGPVVLPAAEAADPA